MLKEFITALGGSEVVATRVSELAGKPLSDRAVYQWHYDGRIPDRWQPYVVILAQEKGVELPPELKPLAEAQKRAIQTPLTNDLPDLKQSLNGYSSDLTTSANKAAAE